MITVEIEVDVTKAKDQEDALEAVQELIESESGTILSQHDGIYHITLCVDDDVPDYMEFNPLGYLRFIIELYDLHDLDISLV